VVRHGDRLEAEAAAGGEQTVDGAEVVRPEALAHRLDHLDADDGVVLADGVAVVADGDRDAVGDTGPLGAGPGELRLLHRQGQRGDAGAALRGTDGRLAPPGADLEDVLAGTDAGHVEDAVDLAVLGVDEGLVRALRVEPGRGVHHRLVEEQREQAVRQVVVPVHVLP
jgi:hypothetical protein